MCSQVTWLGHILLYAACTSSNCIKRHAQSINIAEHAMLSLITIQTHGHAGKITASELCIVCLQYIPFGCDSKLELKILLGLANNCELESSGRDSSLLEQAAEYRQQLFVEMINQDIKIPLECARCNTTLFAHKPSATLQGSKSQILVAPCCHMYHRDCLQEIDEDDGCAACFQQLGLAKRTMTRSEQDR